MAAGRRCCNILLARHGPSRPANRPNGRGAGPLRPPLRRVRPRPFLPTSFSSLHLHICQWSMNTISNLYLSQNLCSLFCSLTSLLLTWPSNNRAHPPQPTPTPHSLSSLFLVVSVCRSPRTSARPCEHIDPSRCSDSPQLFDNLLAGQPASIAQDLTRMQINL